jgi:hypothetical protein
VSNASLPFRNTLPLGDEGKEEDEEGEEGDEEDKLEEVTLWNPQLSKLIGLPLSSLRTNSTIGAMVWAVAIAGVLANIGRLSTVVIAGLTTN